MAFFRLFSSSSNKSRTTPIINPIQGTKPRKYSFEEFKLYYESTEKVTDRRIANNNLNYSICIAVILATGFLWNWAIDHSKYLYPILTLVCLLSIIAASYTQLWLAQIRDYKRLNTAKFGVLNEMAPHVAFTNQKPDIDVDIVSSNPFEKEWEKMKVLGGLQKKSRFNIIGLRSSNQEYFVPEALFVIFLLIAIIALFNILLHLNLFIDQWMSFLQI